MSFLFPTFLIALAAAAVPVLIHLFNFRKFRRLRFTNVKFLQEIRLETDSRSKIKHWLILAARVLTLVFLVLAFSRPYIPSDVRQVAGAANLVGIYIDNSYSMAGPGSEGTLLDQALQKARQIASGYPLNTRFQLLTNDFKGAHRRWVNKDEFTDLLAEVSISPPVRTLDQVLLRMKDSFEQEAAGARRVYIVSDFQKNFIPSSQTARADSALQLSMVMVSGAEMANVAIDSAWFISPVHQAGSLERLVIRLRNYSDQAVGNVPLKLLINGTQESIGSVSLLPRASLNDTLVYRPEQAGWKQGELLITDHPITFDDRFYFSYRVVPRVKVLLIRGAGARNYLDALFSEDEFIELSVNGENSIDYSLIPENNLVILNGISDISSGLAGRLAEFVEQGGDLAIFPSLSSRMAGYNEFLSKLRADTYDSISRQPNQVVRLNTEQAVFRDVFERIPRNPDLPRVQQYFRLNKNSQTLKESLLVMRGNDDLMASYASGEGRVYLSAIPLDEDVSNFPRHALFVPMLYRMALLSMQNYPLYYTLGADQSLQAGSLELSDRSSYRIRKADFEMIPSVRDGGAGSEVFVSDQIPEPGNYTLTGPQREELAVFAFNNDKQESDLSYFGENALENRLEAGAVISPEEGSLERLVSVENFGIQLWKYCVVLALFFLAAEILLIKIWPAAPKLKANG